ncbi:MAG: hypothetical protein CMP11_04930 [Zetaproteobacteria bacterium]|nr:hypothetical protein [Pseudobdellovibrionaceae bacterium]
MKNTAKSNNYLFWIAWRQLVSPRGAGLSFMTIVSVLGVTIGVCALVVVLSVMGGFADDLKHKMFDGLPHVEVFAENPLLGFSLNSSEAGQLLQLHNRNGHEVEPFIKNDVVIKGKKNIAPAALLGLDLSKKGKLWGFVSSWDKEMFSQISESRGSEGLPGIILGEDLAAYLNVYEGDEINILNPQTSLSSVLFGNKISERFLVKGVSHNSIPRHESRYAITSLDRARKFMPDYDQSLDDENYVTGMAVNLKEPEDVDKFINFWQKKGRYNFQTWKDVNSSLLFALELEKYTMSAILLLIVLVAAFSISGTLMMTVYYKKNQISLLQALGMSRNQVLKLYLIHGFSIGFFGSLLGACYGVGICFLLYYFNLVDLSSALYYQSKLPVKILFEEYIVIFFSACVLSLVAAVYPAYLAARQDPVEGLRHT